MRGVGLRRRGAAVSAAPHIGARQARAAGRATARIGASSASDVEYRTDFIVRSIDLMQSELSTGRPGIHDAGLGGAAERMSMGCIARLGCLLVLVATAMRRLVHARQWMPRTACACEPRADGRRGDGVGAADRRRRRRDAAALDRLSQPRGQVFRRCRRRTWRRTPSSRSRSGCRASPTAFDARVDGDRVSMRAVVSVSDLGGGRSLGPLAACWRSRARRALGHACASSKPGLAEFEVSERARFAGCRFRAGMIPRRSSPRSSTGASGRGGAERAAVADPRAT